MILISFFICQSIRKFVEFYSKIDKEKNRKMNIMISMVPAVEFFRFVFSGLAFWIMKSYKSQSRWELSTIHMRMLFIYEIENSRHLNASCLFFNIILFYAFDAVINAIPIASCHFPNHFISFYFSFFRCYSMLQKVVVERTLIENFLWSVTPLSEWTHA